jgi:CheY-like chemotaxis protein
MMNRSQQILVVDDEAPIAHVMRRGLAALGCEALVVSGEESLEIINPSTSSSASTMRPGGAHCRARSGPAITSNRMAMANLRSLYARKPHDLNSFRYVTRQSQLLPMKALDALQRIRTSRSAFTNSL